MKFTIKQIRRIISESLEEDPIVALGFKDVTRNADAEKWIKRYESNNEIGPTKVQVRLRPLTLLPRQHGFSSDMLKWLFSNQNDSHKWSAQFHGFAMNIRRPNWTSSNPMREKYVQTLDQAAEILKKYINKTEGRPAWHQRAHNKGENILQSFKAKHPNADAIDFASFVVDMPSENLRELFIQLTGYDRIETFDDFADATKINATEISWAFPFIQTFIESTF